MRIRDLYARSEPTISFEFFPPKSDEDEHKLFVETVPVLQRLGPAFCSVTYGAGGGTRDRTLRMVERIRTEFDIEAMAHLTCVGSTRDMLAAVLDEAHARGIENILALRGDPPRGQTTFQPMEGGFAYALELIRFVRSRNTFGIGAAFYPEGHIECGNRQLDWDRAAAKVEAGAEFLISQLFYDPNDFIECQEYLRKRGVSVPLIPGILPFLSTAQIKRFTSLCGSKLCDDLVRKLDRFEKDDESVRQLGVEVCTEISRKLLDCGVPGLHIYCLNRAASAVELLTNLGYSPVSSQ